MSETKHSPTPWQVDSGPFAAIGRVLDAQGQDVAQTQMRAGLNADEQVTHRNIDAAHIVACVNAHGDMINTLVAVKMMLLQQRALNSAASDSVDMIDAVLAKAGAL